MESCCASYHHESAFKKGEYIRVISRDNGKENANYHGVLGL